MKAINAIYKNSLTALLMLFAVVSLASCSKDDPPDVGGNTTNTSLIGTWVEAIENEDEYPFILVFNSNNTGEISYTYELYTTRASVRREQSFNWSVNKNANGFDYINIIKIAGDDILEDGPYGYTVVNNTLSFGGKRFLRQQ